MPEARSPFRNRSLAARPRRPAGVTSALAVDQRILIRTRVSIIFALLLLALAGLLVRMAELQIMQGARLGEMADRQQLAKIALPPHRGRVLDRRGRPLAVNVEATSIYAVPNAIADRHAFASALAPTIGVSVDDLVRRLTSGRHFAWLARKVSPHVVDTVKGMRLNDQVGFLAEDLRAYPHGALAAHLLGFVGIDNQGLAGVELAYDEVLRGRVGEAIAERDGIGRVLVETQKLLQPPDDGADVLLTIDQVIQHFAERELEKALTRTNAIRGSVTVIDPKSGEILALAVRPAFDPNAATDVSPHRWLNSLVSEVYEPGSTFKIFLMAAALDSGTVPPTERFFCSGSLQVPGNHTIHDAKGRKHGWQTMGDIVKNSCNVGAAQVATTVGKETFYRYIRRFGFGEAVGVDLPGEARGIVPPPSAWRGPTLQTISFGQGISATAVQVLTAATAFANDGVTVRLHVGRAVRDSQERTVRVIGREPLRPVIRPQTARAILRMMVGTVQDGTGTLAQITGYTVAGKTGTAQKIAASGGYDPGRVIASFLGLVPVADPRLAILVILDEPRGALSGGEVAAPVFREVAAQTLWYLRVPPTQRLGEEATILSDPARARNR